MTSVAYGWAGVFKIAFWPKFQHCHGQKIQVSRGGLCTNARHFDELNSENEACNAWAQAGIFTAPQFRGTVCHLTNIELNLELTSELYIFGFVIGKLKLYPLVWYKNIQHFICWPLSLACHCQLGKYQSRLRYGGIVAGYHARPQDIFWSNPISPRFPTEYSSQQRCLDFELISVEVVSCW